MAASPGRFAITLTLDSSAATAVRRLSRSLDLARVPGTLPAFEPPPHLTLAAGTRLDLELFRPRAAELATTCGPLPCTLASLGVFPTVEGVLFLAPAMSADLVQLQLAVLERLHQTGAHIEPYWLPGQWVPHCTVAIGIPRDTIAAAVGQMLTAFHPIAGELVQLSVSAIDPPKLCYEFPLGQS